LGIISVKETDSHIIVNGIPGLRFSKDIYNVWKTNKITVNLFSSVSRNSVKIPKFYGIELLYIIEQLDQSRRTYTGRRALQQIRTLLLQNTWLRHIGEDGFKSRLDLSKLNDLTVTPFPHQMNFINHYDKVTYTYSLKGMLMDVAAGGGKAQPLDAKIKVPGGWVTMGDMQIGSQITAPDGTTVSVIGVYPQGIKDIYEVEFWDGRKTRACGEHLWETFDGTVREPHRWAIRNTLEMKRLIEKRRQRLYIPLTDAEDGQEVALPADPYLIGALLGDGGLRYDIKFSNPDEDVLNEVCKTLPKYTSVRNINGCDYTITDERPGRNALIDIVRDLGLFGKYSFEKFVPEIYKHGSRQQRLSILQGLLDTDGTVNDHAVVSFCSTSEQLALDVQYLVRSLGGIARISSKRARYTYKGEVREGRVAYNVNIRYKKSSELFRLGRKRARCKDNGQYAEGLKLRVKSISLVGQEAAQCIMVDHPKHLYVTDDFIVTHNTITHLALSHCLGHDTKILFVPKNSVYDVWEKTLKTLFKKGPANYWHSLQGTEPTPGFEYYVVHFDYMEKFLRFIEENKQRFGTVYVGIDESHNFNETSARTDNLIKSAELLKARDVVHASGTPFKAIGSEAITLLKTICNDFTNEVEQGFRKIWGKEAKKAINILANRIGIVSFKVEKAEIETPGVDYKQYKVKLKNGDDYTLTAIRDKMTKFIDERKEFYRRNMAEHERLYGMCMDMHQNTLKTSTARQDFDTYRNYVRQIRKGYDPVTMKDMVMYCNRYELKQIVPSLPDRYRKPFLNVRAIIKYVDLKVMGEALSQVLGRMRIQCHLDMIEHMALDEKIDGSLSKTVIFTSYVEVVKELDIQMTKAGYKPILVYGDTNKDLPAIVKKFENDIDTNPLIATFKSLSTAVPLTMASTLIFTNAPFRDYERTQTIARVDRIGQKHRCLVWEIYLDTGDVDNISTRSRDIMSWSKQQVEAILGVQSPDDLEASLENLAENPGNLDGDMDFIQSLKDQLPVDVMESDDDVSMEGIGSLVGEVPEVKSRRLDEKSMYLYHGTKTPLNVVKKRGLTINDNGSVEARIKGKKIWLTPSKRYASIYGTPLLVKVDTDSVEFVERLPFQKTVNEYVYYKDIPAADILYPGDAEYESILADSDYLIV
jgi:hypothetical protein